MGMTEMPGRPCLLGRKRRKPVLSLPPCLRAPEPQPKFRFLLFSSFRFSWAAPAVQDSVVQECVAPGLPGDRCLAKPPLSQAMPPPR